MGQAVGMCRSCGAQKRLVKGECSACYQRNRRSHAKNVATVAKQAEQIEQTGKDLIAYAAQAKAKLMAALPDAASDLVTASRIAAQKGNSKPAETILREFAISEDGKKRILLSQYSAGQSMIDQSQSGLKVYIGVALGGMKEARRELPEAIDVKAEPQES
jgi:hypothetical protein